MKNIFAVLFLSLFLFPNIVQAATLSERLSGRILLQVESRGEAWYVNPVNEKRYFLGSPDDAWNLMRTLALGISNRDLAQALPARLSGRILLAVEDHGKAFYVDPVTLKTNYLGRPADAFNLMRSKGLGITNANLSSIPVSDSSTTTGESVTNTVTFAAQSPFGEWSDPREQDGCEEASALMAVRWARGESLSLADAQSVILKMSDWEKEQYGTFEDTSVQDTADRLFKGYLNFNNIQVKTDIDTDDIIDALQHGKLIVTAVNGKKLGNPHFVDGGPLRHMILIIGYDAVKKEFIVNDPGTRLGGGYRYSVSIMENALMDYPSGNHVAVTSMPTAMIMVTK